MRNKVSIALTKALIESLINNLDSVALLSRICDLGYCYQSHIALDLNELAVDLKIRSIGSSRCLNSEWFISKAYLEEAKYTSNISFPAGPNIELQVRANARNAHTRTRVCNMPFQSTRNCLSLGNAYGVPLAGCRLFHTSCKRYWAGRQGCSSLNYLRWHLAPPRMMKTAPFFTTLGGAQSSSLRRSKSRKRLAASYTYPLLRIAPVLFTVKTVDLQPFVFVLIWHTLIIPQRILQQRRDPAAFDDRLRYEQVLAMEM